MRASHVAAADAAAVSDYWYTDDQFTLQLDDPARAAVVRRRWHWFAGAIREFARTRDVHRRLDVLDAGCGDGINLVGLRRILDELGIPFRLIAIDLHRTRVARARVGGRAEQRIAVASVTALPFSPGAFDIVLCNHVIEHIPEAPRAADEIARVLRPGGLAIVGVPNEGCALAWLRNHVLQRSILRSTDHVNFFTSRRLSGLLGDAGLSVDRVSAGGFFLPHLRLHALVSSTTGGRAALEWLGQLMPAQAADLVAVATRAS